MAVVLLQDQAETYRYTHPIDAASAAPDSWQRTISPQ